MRTITFMLSLVFIFILPWEGVELTGLGAVAKTVGAVVAAFWVATVIITGRFRQPGAYVALSSALANFASGTAFYTFYDRFSPGDTNPDGFGFILALGIPVAWYLAGSKSTTKMSGLLKLVNYAYIP